MLGDKHAIKMGGFSVTKLLAKNRSPSEYEPHGAWPRRKVKPPSWLAGHVWAVEAL
jgi:hypothetical protein